MGRNFGSYLQQNNKKKYLFIYTNKTLIIKIHFLCSNYEKNISRTFKIHRDDFSRSALIAPIDLCEIESYRAGKHGVKSPRREKYKRVGGRGERCDIL